MRINVFSLYQIMFVHDIVGWFTWSHLPVWCPWLVPGPISLCGVRGWYLVPSPCGVSVDGTCLELYSCNLILTFQTHLNPKVLLFLSLPRTLLLVVHFIVTSVYVNCVYNKNWTPYIELLVNKLSASITEGG